MSAPAGETAPGGWGSAAATVIERPDYPVASVRPAPIQGLDRGRAARPSAGRRRQEGSRAPRKRTPERASSPPPVVFRCCQHVRHRRCLFVTERPFYCLLHAARIRAMAVAEKTETDASGRCSVALGSEAMDFVPRLDFCCSVAARAAPLRSALCARGEQGIDFREEARCLCARSAESLTSYASGDTTASPGGSAFRDDHRPLRLYNRLTIASRFTSRVPARSKATPASSSSPRYRAACSAVPDMAW
jgi:hypothetical protein